MGFLEDMGTMFGPQFQGAPQAAATSALPDNLKAMFAPLMESIIQNATRANDPITRLGNVGMAGLDSAGSGTPFAKNLAALDTQGQQAQQGAANMFLNVLGMDRQVEESRAQERRFVANYELDKERFNFAKAQAGKDSFTIEKVGETKEGSPIYAKVSKSGTIEPLLPSAAPRAVPPRTRAADNVAATEVAGLLDQSKRGPQFVQTNPNARPTIPFEFSDEAPPTQGAEAAKDGDPPYRVWKGKPVLTPAQTEVDKKFGKDYADFTVRGGFADAQKNIAQLSSILERMKKGESLTGPIFGSMPRGAARIAYPKETQALEMVEEVVQRNLRLILGAQFTQKEGERLIQRSYNPALDTKYNAERLGRLVLAMQQALDAKKASADYFEKHGTMAGYRGPNIPSMSAIEGAIDKPDAKLETPKQTGPSLPPGVKVKRSGTTQDGKRVFEGTDGSIYDETGRKLR